MNVLTNETALGRALRVLLYTVITALVAFVTNPDVSKSVTDRYPALTILVVALPPVLSALVNGLRKDVDNV